MHETFLEISHTLFEDICSKQKCRVNFWRGKKKKQQQNSCIFLISPIDYTTQSNFFGAFCDLFRLSEPLLRSGVLQEKPWISSVKLLMRNRNGFSAWLSVPAEPSLTRWSHFSGVLVTTGHPHPPQEPFANPNGPNSLSVLMSGYHTALSRAPLTTATLTHTGKNLI